MKAVESKLLKFMSDSPRFVIPIYQRKYSWEEDECRQLWNDIIEAGEKDLASGHFIGSIVYVEEGIYSITNQSPVLVIDGQQRLTSVTLLLAALANKLKEIPKDKQDFRFNHDMIKFYYLVDNRARGDLRYKLELSETDRDTLYAIIDDKELPKDYSIRVKTNYDLFKKWIDNYNGDLYTIWNGIEKLIMVDISLEKDKDNPQLIFESMNSTGKELTEADLIRNYILMGLDIDLQTELYKDYWKPMEDEFGQVAYTEEFDDYMRHFLTVKTGVIPKKREVYESFKEYSKRLENQGIGVESLVDDIKKYSRYYCAMKLNKEEDKDLRVAFNDIKELKVDVSYPMLLEVYNDYVNELISKDEFLEILRLIESYVFRRQICSIPTNSLNKTFASFMGKVDKENYLESVKAQFQLLNSYRRFPDDEEFEHHFRNRDLYNMSRKNYWLRRLENYNRKEVVEVENYTIEHIMPQNENLSFAWRKELGEDWKKIHETYLHTLGNLTLTGYNPEYSDRPFKEKQNIKNGFKDSPIFLNESLRNVERWNEQAIITRAKILSEKGLKVWKAPKLSEEVINKYKSKPKRINKFSIEQHRYLSKASPRYVPKIRELFDELRKEILDLDPIVSEDFLKSYIAYKAETNFVDIIANSTDIVLYLNMAFPDVSDSRGICRDVTGIGTSGNGDVEIRFSNKEDIPYIMSLIRQSFEKQVSEDGK